MAGIVTLTMNPAIDVSAGVDAVEPSRKLRCDVARRDPGGGGINVARVIRRLGGDATAIFPIGGHVGRMLEELVAKEGVGSFAIAIAGDTREDFTVTDRTSGKEYRFVLPGPPMRPKEWRACLEAVKGLESEPAFLCASGSLPPGAPETFYAELADVAAQAGSKFVLDTSGPALARALDRGAFLIKPNLAELRALTGAPLEDRLAMTSACRALVERGTASIVALTLGHRGALLVSANEAAFAPPLPVAAVSTVGAGDSFLGAMVWSLASGASLLEAFRWGVAAGSAALTAHGTELCREEDVRRLFGSVEVQAVAS